MKTTVRGFVTDIQRMYLGNPSYICVLRFKNQHDFNSVLDTATTNGVLFETLQVQEDTDTCVPLTIIVHPDNLPFFGKIRTLKEPFEKTFL